MSTPEQPDSSHDSDSANQPKTEDFPASPSQGEQETPGEREPQQ
jgi:hypothetical protein